MRTILLYPLLNDPGGCPATANLTAAAVSVCPCSSCWRLAPHLQSQRSTSAAEASCRSAWPASASTARRPRSSSSRSGAARCCRRHRHRHPAHHRHRRHPDHHRHHHLLLLHLLTSFSTNPNPNQVLPVPIPRQSVLACEQALSSRTPAMAEVLIHCRALASRDDGIVDQLPWAWNPSELAKRMPRRLEPSTSRRKKSQAGLVLLLTRA